ncbi:MAG TPA: hypothetical protein VFC74_00780 [Oscillospiraceae bacterium]|nr:hypothetical protein [Oscillospiraceae bacterium]
MCHRETNYEFAIMPDNEISKIRDVEKTLSQNGEVILLAYKRSDQNVMDD